MFSRQDADRIRASLGPMDFQEQSRGDDCLQIYRDHYGLNFRSRQLPVEHRAGILNCPPFQLVCQNFNLPSHQQRGTAFLLHGYFDHSGLYGHLILHCLKQGFSVVIFDLPGHGLSSGVPASIDSFARYAQALQVCLQTAREQNLSQPWVALGQSTGGAVLMDSLLRRALAEEFTLARYVLLAPLLRPFRWPQTRLLFSLVRWFQPATRRRFSANSHDPAFLQFLRDDPLQSRLLPRDWVLAMMAYQRNFRKAPACDEALHIIQGTADRTVDWPYNLAHITEKFPRARTYLVSDARHHLVNESTEYRDQVFKVITQLLEPVGREPDPVQ